MNVVVETIDSLTLAVSAGAATTRVDRSGRTGAAGFRSVDLLLAGLGSCMIGTMLNAAEKASISVTNARVELRPIVALTPERVSRIRMTMSVAGDIDGEQLKVLKAAAESCKVHNTLHHGVETELRLDVVAGTPSPDPGSDLHV